MEPEETHAQALRRECAEELGIDIDLASSDADLDPCWSFSHLPQPDKDQPGQHIVFRLFFYWATYDVAAQPQPQPLAAQRLDFLTPREMVQLDFCPGCKEIREALASGQLRPPPTVLKRARTSA